MQEPNSIEGNEATRKQQKTETGERPKRRIGILSFSSPGHYYPLTALGRRLQSRGHEVVYFQVADLERPIRAAGLQFCQIGRHDFPLGALRARDEEVGQLEGAAALRCGLLAESNGRLRCSSGTHRPRSAMRGSTLSSSIKSRWPAGPSPNISVCRSSAWQRPCRSISIPASRPSLSLGRIVPVSGLGSGIGWATRFASGPSRGSYRRSTDKRRIWGLPRVRNFNGLFSGLAHVSQLPAALELPGRRLPPQFYHTGPWTDAAGRMPVYFPWSRLDRSRPLVYVSMGTLQNGILRTFRVIAEACVGLDLQLVISLGGGQDPALLRDLPGTPVVVGYAPQLDLIRRSALTISHGGLNTALESLSRGVPMVVLPVTYDQPGVGAWVEWSGSWPIDPYRAIRQWIASVTRSVSS